MNYNNNFGEEDNIRDNIANGLRECIGLIETFQKCYKIRGIDGISEIEVIYQVEPPQPK